MPTVIACRLLSGLVEPDNDGTRTEATGWTSTATALPTGEYLDLFDRSGFVSPDAPDQITVPVDGTYIVIVELPYAVASSYPETWRVRVWKNGDDTDPQSFTSSGIFQSSVNALAVSTPHSRSFLAPLSAGDYLRVYVSFESEAPAETGQAYVAVDLLLLGSVGPPAPGPSGTYGVPPALIDSITVVDGGVTGVTSHVLTAAEISPGLDALGGISGSF